MTTKKNPSKLRAFIQGIIKFITTNILAAAALTAIAVIALPVGFYGMYLYIEPQLPSVSELKKADYKMPLQIYTKEADLIGEFGRDMSLPVAYNDVPKKMIHAFLAAEDDTFFTHDGISVKGLGRAITETITGSDQQTGGSTITMQVAKNYFLSSDRTIKRKLTEIFLARRIEQNLSKEEILTLYINKIYLGQNAYGIKAAAKRYYSKNLESLTTAQMAMIAGMPKAPSKYNPIANPPRALERRNWILGRMAHLGYISQSDYKTAVEEPNELKLYQTTADKSFPYLAEWARYELVQRFGKKAMTSGWRVKLTVSSERQSMAESALKRGLNAYDRRHGMRAVEASNKPLRNFHTFDNRWPAKVIKLHKRSFDAELKDGRIITVPWYSKVKWINANRRGYYSSNPAKVFKIGDIVRVRPNKKQTSWNVIQTPVVQGALVALDPDTGALEAMAGGYDFYKSKFNRVTQGWRQPGSIIKPFIYTLALENGYRPNSMVSDEKIRVGSWRPKNADGRYYGKMPLRQALYLSRNMVSIRLLQSVGISEARQFLSQFGLTQSKLPSNYTLALGTGQVLPLQMATGYAAFANGGHRIQPYFIDSIYDIKGNLVYLANPARACAVCHNEKLEQAMASTLPTHKPKKTKKNSTGKKAQPKNNASENTTNTDIFDAGPEKDRLYHFNSAKLAAAQAPRIISPNVAYDMASILKDVVTRGTGKKAMRTGRRDIAGKTGTTNDSRDAWFAGFQPTLVAVAWVGFDTPSSLGRREYGGVAALPVWMRFMSAALKGTPHQWVTTRNVSQSRKQQSKIITEDDTDTSNDIAHVDFEMPPAAYYIQKPRPKPKPIFVPKPSNQQAEHMDNVVERSEIIKNRRREGLPTPSEPTVVDNSPQIIYEPLNDDSSQTDTNNHAMTNHPADKLAIEQPKPKPESTPEPKAQPKPTPASTPKPTQPEPKSHVKPAAGISDSQADAIMQ